MESRELAIQAAIALDKKKAANIKVIKVRDLTVLTDYFVIANGRNVQSVHTLAEDLEEKLAELGEEPRRKEGYREAKWIVLDYAHVIVHIFHPEEREFYNIERLWQDGHQVNLAPVLGENA